MFPPIGAFEVAFTEPDDFVGVPNASGNDIVEHALMGEPVPY